MSRLRWSQRTPVLGNVLRTLRLTRVELSKLRAHKLFPLSVVITFAVTTALAFAGKYFAPRTSATRFSNYSLWVVSASFGLEIGTILLAALGAMTVSSEATARTLNTMLARPIRRLEFMIAKALSIVFATVVIVGAASLAGFLVGGTVPPRGVRHHVVVTREDGAATFHRESPGLAFPTYDDVVDPDHPTVLIASKRQVMGDILLGFILLVIPILAAASFGFLIGTLIDSAALAVGIAVGLFVSLEATKFLPLFEDYLGPWAFNHPITKLATQMQFAGMGDPPLWDKAIGGVAISGIYVGVCMLVAFFVFCRRDVTL